MTWGDKFNLPGDANSSRIQTGKLPVSSRTVVSLLGLLVQTKTSIFGNAGSTLTPGQYQKSISTPCVSYFS